MKLKKFINQLKNIKLKNINLQKINYNNINKSKIIEKFNLNDGEKIKTNLENDLNTIINLLTEKLEIKKSISYINEKKLNIKDLKYNLENLNNQLEYLKNDSNESGTIISNVSETNKSTNAVFRDINENINKLKKQIIKLEDNEIKLKEKIKEILEDIDNNNTKKDIKTNLKKEFNNNDDKIIKFINDLLENY